MGYFHSKGPRAGRACATPKGTNTSRPEDDDFLGVAEGITNLGIPSVLRFREPVADGGAIIRTLRAMLSLGPYNCGSAGIVDTF